MVTVYNIAKLMRGLVLLLGLLVAGAFPQTSVAGTFDPTGVWVAGGADRPALSGSIRLFHSGPVWSAVVGTSRATGAAARGGIAFRFAGGAGELWIPSAVSDRLAAMWSQPGSAIDSNPYSSPVLLRARAAGGWAGTLMPFVPRYELYISFVRNADGSLGGFMRDPVGDFGTMAPFQTVALDGANITITTRAHVFHGSVDATAQTLTLGIGTGPPMHFHRLDPSVSNGYFPIDRGDDSSFTRPAEHDDGWKTGVPSSAGIDDARLQQLANYLASQTPTSPGSPYIQSVLIARNDRLIAEHYYYGFHRTRPHDVRSAGKSLDAALFGAAVRLAPTLTVDSPAYRWLPYSDFAHPDKRKSLITVADFFDMTSGIDCDDNNDASLGNEDTMQSQVAQPDWYRYMMDLPMVRDPGSRTAAYCSGGINMIGAFIVRATHRWTPELFDNALARPMQFGLYHLQLTPTGEMYLGGGSYFLPRDFLKLGQVFLDDGVWNGRRILSQAWVHDAVTAHSGLNGPNDYGYGWHLTHYHTSSATYDAFEAQGNGGRIRDRRSALAIGRGNHGRQLWQLRHLGPLPRPRGAVISWPHAGRRYGKDVRPGAARRSGPQPYRRAITLSRRAHQRIETERGARG